jgi:DUF1365 family protein
MKMKSPIKSAIYSGKLRHRRFFPKAHEFTYDAYMFYLDLEELPELFSQNKFWSFNRFNLGWFNRKDYFGDAAIPLDQAVRDYVKQQLGDCPEGPIRLLTQLRIWGFCFNPLSLYFIFDKDADTPKYIVAEVNNTPWNQRHAYLLACDEKGKINTEFSKQFHVSPFNPIDMQYHWISTSPDEQLVVHMENLQQSAECLTRHMDATLTLKREQWSAKRLNTIVWTMPWLAIKIPIAIYWQALRLLIKGVPVYSHSSPSHSLTSHTKSLRGVAK